MPAPLAVVLLVLMVLLLALPAAAKYPDDLPPAEKEMAATVDPWGLPFSDSLRRWDERFAARPEASFAVGVTHDLVKIWPNKYWFRGSSVLAAPAMNLPSRLEAPAVFAAAGETQAFQIAILPRMGSEGDGYQVSVLFRSTYSSCQVFREYFVKTPQPGYPRYPVERWPDPLVSLTGREPLTVSGTDCLPVWIDVPLAADLPAGTLDVSVQVVNSKSENAVVVVPIRVVPGLRLEPKRFPLVAWFRQKYGKHELTSTQWASTARLVLEHHLQPMDLLKGHFDPANTVGFERLHRYLAERGQTVFELDPPGKKYDFKLLYDHVKKEGWLNRALIYSNNDEPLEETFRTSNVPWFQDLQQKYPGLRVFLASEYHPRMEDGCDIWMTDLSTMGYDPEKMRDLQAPTLWNYYCHLPVHMQFRAPLTQAPNMEIDCDALQHRLALWMSNYYGAKGVFIWAGFCEDFADDFWTTLALSDKPSGYPYGGLHNGNNFLIYPPREEGGPLVPSLRLKVLRAGMQDLALLREVQRLLDEGKITGARAKRLRELLSPVPGLFVHPQYWDRLPETLLARREAILRALASQ
jgi:hypothetical protein